MRWALMALFIGWILALGYYALRVSLFAVPDYCPGKIWDARPPECDWTSFDVALFTALPILVVATALSGFVTLARKLRSGHQGSP